MLNFLLEAVCYPTSGFSYLVITAIVPFERAMAVFYRLSIVTTALSTAIC